MNSTSFPGLKQFRADGCLSYLLSDPVSRKAVLVDPNLDLLDDYRTQLADLGLKLVSVLETHIHADHYSASHLLGREYGADIAMSEITRSERATVKLRHGSRVAFGAFELEVMETPGHTPDSLSFRCPGEDTGFVLTGDTLLIGSSGRTDFPGADPSQQWKSLHEVLGSLPEDTVVLPGHDYSDLLFTTLGTEMKSNEHWLIADLNRFVALKKDESMPNASEEIRARVDFNIAASPEKRPRHDLGGGAATVCGKSSIGGDRTASISVEKYRAKLQEKARGTRFIDVREPGEYREGHIPGVENIPLSELVLHLKSLREAGRVYVSCLSGRRSAMATKTLNYVGLPDVVNVSGGYKAWQQAGLPIQ